MAWTSSAAPVLALNSGSSSLKFGVFAENQGDVQALYRGSLDGIGAKASALEINAADGRSIARETHSSETQTHALRAVGASLEKLDLPPLAAVGHRIVHGGPQLREHQRLTPEVLKTLGAAASFAPLHVPIELELIRETHSQFPSVLQFACFDTAFHRTLPETAAHFALPQKFWEAGVRRYGFHGLSCESILHTLGDAIPSRAVIAHLGNGASVTAVANGRSVDTSMGLTPTGGIIMGTRTGDLDPGVFLHVMRTQIVAGAELEKLVNQQSGLLGISGISSDMRELHQAGNNALARLAVEMFARTVKKQIGAFAALLGGLDLLVFSGGIGEHDAAVRAEICEGLDFLGIALDEARNAQGAAIINNPSGSVTVRIVRSDEEAQIARHVFRLLA
jgi:acetate kinase